MIEYFRSKWGEDWRNSWIDKEINPDWYSSPVNYGLSEKVYNMQSAVDVENYIIEKYVDVEIVSIVRTTEQLVPGGPLQTYFLATFDIGQNSPYYIQGNVIELQVTANSREEVINQFNDTYLLLEVRLIREFGFNNLYYVVALLLPENPNFVKKYRIQLSRKWKFDDDLPDLAQNEYLYFNDDNDLQNWLNSTLPTNKMRKALYYFALIFYNQTASVLNPGYFSLMPIYVNNVPTDSTKLKLYMNDIELKGATDSELPLIMLKDSKLLLNIQELGLDTILALDPWYSKVLNNKKVSDWFKIIINSVISYKGVFTALYDPNDIFSEDLKPLIYEYVPVHKLQKLIHTAKYSLNSVIEADTGNSHEQILTPTSTITKARITDATRLYTKITTFLRPSKFKNSVIQTNIRNRFLPTKYIYELNPKFAVIDEFNFARVIKTDENAVFIENPFIYFLDSGDQMHLFADGEVVEGIKSVKTIYIDEDIDTFYTNIAVAYGNQLYPIVQKDEKTVTVYMETDDITEDNIGEEIEIVTYCNNSIPGELNNNPFLGKKIPIVYERPLEFDNNVNSNLILMNYTENDYWLVDLLNIFQNSMHIFVLNFAFSSYLELDSVDIISQFDSDRGFASGRILSEN